MISHQRRRAFTLVELITVMGFMSAAMIVIASLIHLLLNIDRGGREHDAGVRRWSILWEQVRRDVHGAVAAVPEADGLRLDAGGGTLILYRFRETEGALRIRRDAEGHEHQKAFPLGRGATAEVSVSDPDHSVTVSLKKASGGPVWRGTARIGRDHRFETAEVRDAED